MVQSINESMSIFAEKEQVANVKVQPEKESSVMRNVDVDIVVVEKVGNVGIGFEEADSVNAEAKETRGREDRRGILMLKHIPQGFYEKEIFQFFRQFGRVRRVKVARSKKTGKSKGYAYVWFEYEEVAKIAADFMDSYMMFEKLVKCKLLGPTTDPKTVLADDFFKYKDDVNLGEKQKLLKSNQKKSAAKQSVSLESRVLKLQQLNVKLASLGINFQFILPEMQAHPVKKKEIMEFSPKILRSNAKKSEIANFGQLNSSVSSATRLKAAKAIPTTATVKQNQGKVIAPRSKEKRKNQKQKSDGKESPIFPPMFIRTRGGRQRQKKQNGISSSAVVNNNTGITTRARKFMA